MIWFLSAQWRASKELGLKCTGSRTPARSLCKTETDWKKKKKTGQREGLKKDYGDSEGFIKYVKIHLLFVEDSTIFHDCVYID